MNTENTEVKDKNTEEVVTDKFTRWTYVRNEVVYAVDEITKERKGEPLKVDEAQSADAAAKYESLKQVIQAFLSNEKYNAIKDGNVFYAPNGNLVYVGFARIEDDKNIHEHLAVFFRTEVEVTTKMTAFDVTLEEIKDAFKE